MLQIEPERRPKHYRLLWCSLKQRMAASLIVLAFCPVQFAAALEPHSQTQADDSEFLSPTDAARPNTASPSKGDRTVSNDPTLFVNPEETSPEAIAEKTAGHPRLFGARNIASPPQTYAEKTAGSVSVSVPGPEKSTDIADTTNQGSDALNTAAGDPKVPDAVVKDAPIDERDAYELVRSGFVADKPEGTLLYLKGKNSLDTSFPDAIKRALQKNLAIKFQEKTYEKSASTVTRAKAAFDPVFNVSLAGNQVDSYDRQEFMTRKRISFETLQSAFSQNLSFPTTGDAFTVPSPGLFINKGAFDFASQRSESQQQSATANLSEQVPWGPVFNASLTTLRQETVFSDSTSNSNEVGLDTRTLLNLQGFNLQPGIFYQSQSRFNDANNPKSARQRPWTSDLNLNLTVPVPCCKDFGPYGSAEVPIKFAKIGRERAYWQVQSAINGTMLNVNTAYWELVRSVRRLDVTTKNRKNIGTVVKQTQDLLNANRATNYEKSQIDAEYARLRGLEESAWANFVVASNNLKQILYYEKEAVLVPIGYGPLLGDIVIDSQEDARHSALEKNPDLQAIRTDERSAEVSLKFANNQSRPDLRLSSGVSFNQSAAVYGYNDIGPSLKSIFNPDSRIGFVALNFHVPWGNRPAEAELAKAEQQYLEAEKNLTQEINFIEQNVDNSLEAVASAKHQVTLARKNLEIATRVFATTLQLAEQGRVPDLAAGKSNPAFTIVSKNDDLLQAAFRYIDAQIFLKESEGQLLAGEGIIASRLSEAFNISVTPVDPVDYNGVDKNGVAIAIAKDGDKAPPVQPANEPFVKPIAGQTAVPSANAPVTEKAVEKSEQTQSDKATGEKSDAKAGSPVEKVRDEKVSADQSAPVKTSVEQGLSDNSKDAEKEQGK